MDQATQILLGGVTAQALFTRPLGRWAGVVGGVAGLIPDLDMLLAPLADPHYPVEVHRTFSHSLAAMPVGAALTTLLFLTVPSLRRRWRWVFGAALAAWITHAPLDVCTSYGTMILWPFDRTWFAWDLIAIFDPVFSLVLLLGLVLAFRRRRARPAVLAFLICLLYLGLGAAQKSRALDAQAHLIQARGHHAVHRRVMPQLGGLLFWRSLYRTEAEIHADQIRLAPLLEPAVDQAGRTPLFTRAMLPDGLPPEDLDRYDRYQIFTDGFQGRVSGQEAFVGDMRYSVAPGFAPVWGLQVVPQAPLSWSRLAKLGDRDLSRLARTMLGLGRPYVPLSETP